ncbi:hypothetical protein EPO05_05045 [Patescibacteria group bacterium]|nr:MAG: hypothetical protein EPO05_05045 [Patescibacteria group bacterium]
MNQKLKSIIKIIFKALLWAILALVAIIVLLLVYFNWPAKVPDQQFGMGVTFSSRYSKDIGLDWKENYTAMLDDLEMRKIRVPVYWDLVEPEQGKYDFADVDWQLDEAGKRGAEVILVVGQKVPRWPECFIPKWAENDDQLRKAQLIKEIKKVVERYKDHPAVKYWQVENEPFLKFGICPPLDTTLLDSEISMVRYTDPSRPVIVTDSGELSLWVQAAKRADIFGTTMYRTIWKKGVGYFEYPIGPRFFQFKHWLIKTFAHQDKAIVIELQGEPWIAGWTVSRPLEEQYASMNPDQLKENVEFAKKTGFSDIYVWGVEWWYWLKKTQNDPSLWDTAKEIYRLPK